MTVDCSGGWQLGGKDWLTIVKGSRTWGTVAGGAGSERTLFREHERHVLYSTKRAAGIQCPQGAGGVETGLVRSN